jgi:hypothetical protein
LGIDAGQGVHVEGTLFESRSHFGTTFGVRGHGPEMVVLGSESGKGSDVGSGVWTEMMNGGRFEDKGSCACRIRSFFKSQSHCHLAAYIPRSRLSSEIWELSNLVDRSGKGRDMAGPASTPSTPSALKFGPFCCRCCSFSLFLTLSAGSRDRESGTPTHPP